MPAHWGGRLIGTDTAWRRRRNKGNRAKRRQRRTGRVHRIPGSRKGYGYSRRIRRPHRDA